MHHIQINLCIVHVYVNSNPAGYYPQKEVIIVKYAKMRLYQEMPPPPPTPPPQHTHNIYN